MLVPYFFVNNNNVYYLTVTFFLMITDHFFSLLRVTKLCDLINSLLLIRFCMGVLVFNQIIYHIHREAEGFK